MRAYRASSLGYSLCQLVAPHLGYEPVDPPEWLQKVYDLGHELEPKVIQELKDVGWEVWGEQEEVELEVIPGTAKVVGHIDGKTRTSPGSPDRILEIKTMSHRAHSDWSSNGWDSNSSLIKKYRWQASAYMLASGLSHVLVAWDKDTQKSWVKFSDEPFYTISDIANKLQQAEDYINAGVVPDECNDFPCPYFYLHGEKKEASPTVPADDELEAILSAWGEADRNEKIYGQEKKVLREQIIEMLGEERSAGRIKGRNVTVETTWQTPSEYTVKRKGMWVTKIQRMKEKGMDVTE